MPYLLDTHVVLWAVAAPARLSRRARGVLEDPASPLVISAASAWELATKHRLGKLPSAEVLLTGFSRHVRRLGATSLPIAVEHTLLAGALTWQHRDPFDRILVAQCLAESLVLITGDEAVSDVNGLVTLW